MTCCSHIVNQLLEVARISLEKNNITIIPIYYDSMGYIVYARVDKTYIATLTLEEIEALVNLSS